MQIWIGASDNKQLVDAQRWVTDKALHSILHDLETWAISKESTWGECYIFIETFMPQGRQFAGTRNQIDLLIAFSSTAALCELKGHANEISVDDLRRSVRQIRDQRDWIVDLIRGIWERQSIYPFLFLHRMFPNKVRLTAKRMIDVFGAIEIWPVGAHPNLVGTRIGDRPLYFTDGVAERLSRHSTPQLTRDVGLQSFLYDQIVQNESTILPFPNFENAKKFLKYACNLQVRHEPWYVSSLRQQQLEIVSKILNELSLVEIVGTPGVGKSVLAKELIGRGENMVLEVELSNCRSVSDVCRQIDARLNGDLLEGAGEETYIGQLSAEPYTFWIRSYDEPSAMSVNEFLRVLHTVQRESLVPQSRWIVESRNPLPSCVQNRFELGALDNLSISRILSGIERGGAFDDLEDVVDRAQGNPRRAVMLWRSQTADQTDDVDDFSWFRRQLTREEKVLLPILCHAGSTAPLGLTLKSLVGAADYCGLLKPQIQSTFDSLLEKLDLHQLAEVRRFETGAFDDLLEDILPDKFSLVIVNHINSSLIDEVGGTLRDAERAKLIELLSEVFLDTQHTDSLAYITFALTTGDLEPFFRSSFRYTSLGEFLHWIDRTRWIPPNPRQAYLLKALRVLTNMRRELSGDSGGLLDPPDKTDSVQCFAYTFVTARALTVKQFSPTINLGGLLNAIPDRYKDPDLQVAAYMSISNALQNADRPQDAWRVLRDLPARFEANSTAKALSIHRSLEFLNGSKNRRRVLTDEEAYPLIRELAKELINEGLRIENLPLICDGLFHYIRAQEMRAARISCREVLSYREALKFVEEGPRTRIRQRLKILLTQGSIHRHFSRDGGLTWVEFAQHFNEGTELYLRAFRSAQVHNHTLHQLNAASYMINLCLTALRFGNEAAASDFVIERVNRIIPLIKSLDQHLALDRLWEGEKIIFSNIQRNFPILLYLSAVSAGLVSNRIGELVEYFARAVQALLTECDKAKHTDDRIQAMKNLEFSFRGLNRAFDFGDKRNLAYSTQLIDALRPHLILIINGARGVTQHGKVEKERQKLYQRLSISEGSSEGSQ